MIKILDGSLVWYVASCHLCTRRTPQTDKKENVKDNARSFGWNVRTIEDVDIYTCWKCLENGYK
jgi:transketolase N-terminal domain/subunit